MLPAFGSPEAKALLPIFEHYAEQVSYSIVLYTARLSNSSIRWHASGERPSKALQTKLQCSTSSS